MEIHRIVDDLQPDTVVAPLGVGRHIDHTITHIATRQFEARSTPIWWYEDLPYALYPELSGWETRLTSALSPIPIPLAVPHWTTKITAVTSYASQHGVLWHALEPWPNQLRDYAKAIGEGQ